MTNKVSKFRFRINVFKGFIQRHLRKLIEILFLVIVYFLLILFSHLLLQYILFGLILDMIGACILARSFLFFNKSDFDILTNIPDKPQYSREQIVDFISKHKDINDQLKEQFLHALQVKKMPIRDSERWNFWSNVRIDAIVGCTFLITGFGLQIAGQLLFQF